MVVDVKPERPPKKNQPIAVLTYDDPVEMFVKKEPTVNKFNLDKAGNLGFTFSKPMVWPANWVAMHERYLAKQAAIAAREAKLNGGRRL